MEKDFFAVVKQLADMQTWFQIRLGRMEALLPNRAPAPDKASPESPELTEGIQKNLQATQSALRSMQLLASTLGNKINELNAPSPSLPTPESNRHRENWQPGFSHPLDLPQRKTQAPLEPAPPTPAERGEKKEPADVVRDVLTQLQKPWQSSPLAPPTAPARQQVNPAALRAEPPVKPRREFSLPLPGQPAHESQGKSVPQPVPSPKQDKPRAPGESLSLNQERQKFRRESSVLASPPATFSKHARQRETILDTPPDQDTRLDLGFSHRESHNPRAGWDFNFGGGSGGGSGGDGNPETVRALEKLTSKIEELIGEMKKDGNRERRAESLVHHAPARMDIQERISRSHGQ